MVNISHFWYFFNLRGGFVNLKKKCRQEAFLIDNMPRQLSCRSISHYLGKMTNANPMAMFGYQGAAYNSNLLYILSTINPVYDLPKQEEKRLS